MAGFSVSKSGGVVRFAFATAAVYFESGGNFTISSPGMIGGELQAWTLVSKRIIPCITKTDFVFVICIIVTIHRTFINIPLHSRRKP